MVNNEKIITLAIAGVIVIILFATVFNVVSDYSKFKYGETIVITQIEGDSIEYAMAQFNTIPEGAELFINDIKYTTPTSHIVFNEGTYDYTIALSGFYTVKSSVSLYNGLSKEITYAMEPAPNDYVAPIVPDPVPTTPLSQDIPVQFKFVSAVPGIVVNNGGYIENVDTSALYLINTPLKLTQGTTVQNTETSTSVLVSPDKSITYELRSSHIISGRSIGSMSPPDTNTIFEIPIIPKSYGFIITIASKSDGTPLISGKPVPIAFEVENTLSLASLSPGDVKYNIYLSPTTSMPSRPTYVIYNSMIDESSFNSVDISILTRDLGQDSDIPGDKELYMKIEEFPTLKTETYKLSYKVSSTYLGTSYPKRV